MISCPICRNKEWNGTLFCSECGTQLGQWETPTTQHIQKPSEMLEGVKVARGEAPEAEAQAVQADAGPAVSLNLMDSGQILPLVGQEEFSIGRSAEGQPIIPDVDLAAYDAYNLGVSRLHALIKVANELVQVTDLGSSNGTRVNGQKLVAHVAYAVNNGDLITLGKFALQILIRS